MRFSDISIYSGIILVVYFLKTGYKFLQPLGVLKPDEQLVFVSHYNSSVSIPGKPFDPNLLHLLSKYGLTAQNHSLKQTVQPDNVVFVTYASSNHFSESRAGLFKLRKLLPNKIVYYDVGLSRDEAEDIKSFCNLEYRKFDFDQHPKHVENLMNYAFKAIIEAVVYAEFPAFWMFDASLRISNKIILLEFYNKINQVRTEKFVLPLLNAGHSILAATHPGMFEYLKMSKNQRKSTMDQATSFIVRSDFSREAVKWNFMCAMTEHCIAPEGHSVVCHFDIDRTNNYANCHRYDQSAINIILSSLRLKYNVVPYSKIPTHRFIILQRDDQYNGTFDSVCRKNEV